MPPVIMSQESNRDIIFLRNLQLSAVVGPDAWRRPNKAQPVLISIRCVYDTQSAGSSDDINDTLSYGRMCKEITAAVEGQSWRGLGHLISGISEVAVAWPIKEKVKVSILLPKAVLRLDGGIKVESTLRRLIAPHGNSRDDTFKVDHSEWFLNKLRSACIIGVNNHEREEKQDIVIEIQSPNVRFGFGEIEEKGWERDWWRDIVRQLTRV